MDESEAETQPTQQTTLDAGLLIETIQNYEFLYDLSNKEYKNGKKKDLAWKEIAEILNASVEDCMKCWRNVRDRFVKEKKKNRSGDEAPEMTWPYYNAMLFYGKFTKRRNTYNSIDQKKKGKPLEATSSRPSSAASVWSTVDTILSPPGTPLDNENESEVEVTPSSSKGNRGKSRSTDDQCLTEVVNAAKDIASSIKESANSSNSNKRFTEYVYVRLQEMSAEEGKEKRRKMLLILEDLD